MFCAIGRGYKFFLQGCKKGTSCVGVFIAKRWIDSVVDVEKDVFWDSFIIVLSGTSKQDNIFIGSDLNGHFGRDAGCYGGVHGGMGFGTTNVEGESILEFGDAVGMAVCNTFFKKEDSKLITYQFGDNRSIDSAIGSGLDFNFEQLWVRI